MYRICEIRNHSQAHKWQLRIEKTTRKVYRLKCNLRSFVLYLSLVVFCYWKLDLISYLKLLESVSVMQNEIFNWDMSILTWQCECIFCMFDSATRHFQTFIKTKYKIDLFCTMLWPPQKWKWANFVMPTTNNNWFVDVCKRLIISWSEQKQQHRADISNYYEYSLRNEWRNSETTHTHTTEIVEMLSESEWKDRGYEEGKRQR